MSPRFSPSWLDELRARSDIVSVVSGYVPLKKNGHRYSGLCPFHHETAPSFSVDAQKQCFYCFGCKAGGTVIDFVMNIERLDFAGAVAFLAERAQLALPEARIDPEEGRRRSRRERAFQTNQAAARYYHENLFLPACKPVYDYLKGRGLSDGVIRKFGIGASMENGGVRQALAAQGFTDDDLLDAGLIAERDGRRFDMFRNRAMFPIIDAGGRVLGFGGRAMGDQQPKYLNTSDTVAFNKRVNVYAANLLRKTRNLKRVLLVEGYMDVVAVSQYGIEGAAATLGTALTPEQARLMTRFADEVHIAYDGDNAGRKAILRALDVFSEQNIPARVLDIPGGMDPDEYLRARGAEAFEQLQPMRGDAYRLLRAKDGFDLSTEDGRIACAKASAAILRTVRDPVERESYLRTLAVETGFPREVLLEQMGATPPDKAHTTAPRRTTYRQKTEAVRLAEDRLTDTLLAVLATGRVRIEGITPALFPEGLRREMAEGLLGGQSAATVIGAITDDAARAEAARILETDASDDDAVLTATARDCLRKIGRHALETELETIGSRMASLPPAEQAAQTARANEIMRLLMQDSVDPDA